MPESMKNIDFSISHRRKELFIYNGSDFLFSVHGYNERHDDHDLELKRIIGTYGEVIEEYLI